MADIQKQPCNNEPPSSQLQPDFFDDQDNNDVEALFVDCEHSAFESEDSLHNEFLSACVLEKFQKLQLLVKQGAEVDKRDNNGFTPLMMAAKLGYTKVAKFLLDNHALIDKQSRYASETALSFACRNNHYEIVDLLLKRGANIEHKNRVYCTPLCIAAWHGHVKIIELLLNHGAKVDYGTNTLFGMTPLMLAVTNGHTAAVKLLLDYGSDVDALSKPHKETALNLACKYGYQGGRENIVSLLVDLNADIEFRSRKSLTPLMEAARGRCFGIAKILLAKGAKVNVAANLLNETPLTFVISSKVDKDYYRFIKLLLEKGAEVEVKNSRGRSPLWLAAKRGYLNLVELLHKLGAEVDLEDKHKVSCLMVAFQNGHVEVVKYLIKHVIILPNDQHMTGYIETINDNKVLVKKCQECLKIIRAVKKIQDAEAKRNEMTLLKELDMEKKCEESKKKAATARKRDRKKQKKVQNKEENNKN